jgi:hypothetical protein
VFLGVIRQVARSALAAGFKNVFIMGDVKVYFCEARVAAFRKP